MATMTLYRPIGSAELSLIKEAAWRAFPQMPQGHPFYVFTVPPEEVLAWKEALSDWINQAEYWPTGAREIVESWDAWGNSPDRAFVVAFEVDEHSALRRDGWWNRSYSVDEINDALIGPISLHADEIAE